MGPDHNPGCSFFSNVTIIVTIAVSEVKSLIPFAFNRPFLPFLRFSQVFLANGHNHGHS